MRVVYLVLVVQVHAWMRCDKTTIHTTIGGEMNLHCSYKANNFLFSKKYWCFGESRSTCEVLMDTDGFTTARFQKKARIYESLRTVHILMTDLQLEDAGIYWAGIDKVYADIMFRVNVVVAEEAVSRPRVWLDVSPVVTCHGQMVLLHCRTDTGTNVKYMWSREVRSENIVLQSSADLLLRCVVLTEDARYVCSARNAVSWEQSKMISLHILQAGHENCVYVLTSDELESYDCRTTTALPVTSAGTAVEVSSSEFSTQSRSGGNQTLCRNQTQDWNENISYRLRLGVPLWYDIVRWLLFIAMVTSIGLLHTFTKRSKRATATT